MKKFLILSTVFLFPVIMFLGFLELQLRNYENTYDQKKHFLELRCDQIEALILGDSHAHSAIDPAVLGMNSFNLANDGQSLYYDIMLTEEYIDLLPKLKTVIIPISYFTFYYIMQNSFAEPRQYNYYHTFRIPLAEKAKILDLRKFNLTAAYTPKIAFGIVFLGRYKSSGQKANGFLPRIGRLSENVNPAVVREKISYHDEVIRKGDLRFNLTCLNEFLALLKSKKITPIFVSIPVSKAYRDQMDLSITKENTKIIDQLCDVYQISYIDLDSMFQRSNQYFEDVDHLNALGARTFTASLTKLVQNHSTDPSVHSCTSLTNTVPDARQKH